jgi:hypothetical protein
MKKIISILAIIAALVIGIIAQQSKQITLAWDAESTDQKWTEVRIYDVSQSPEALVATVTCVPPAMCANTVTFSVPRAAHNYVARSYDGFWESGDSNVVLIPAPPKVITGLVKK